jgi:hypothetical protein
MQYIITFIDFQNKITQKRIDYCSIRSVYKLRLNLYCWHGFCDNQYINQPFTNMKPTLVKLIVLTFCAFLISCQKDNDSISNQIVGKWEWVKSVSPWAGQIFNNT